MTSIRLRAPVGLFSSRKMTFLRRGNRAVRSCPGRPVVISGQISFNMAKKSMFEELIHHEEGR